MRRVRLSKDSLHHGENFWGLTASDGPGWITRRTKGFERTCFDYAARVAPYGPDDGTIAPWAVAASLPFAPDIVLPTLKHDQDVYPQVTGEYCFRCSFRLSFCDEVESDNDAGWISPHHFGVNLGPVVLMCENYRSAFLRRSTRACPYVVAEAPECHDQPAGTEDLPFRSARSGGWTAECTIHLSNCCRTPHGNLRVNEPTDSETK